MSIAASSSPGQTALLLSAQTYFHFIQSFSSGVCSQHISQEKHLINYPQSCSAGSKAGPFSTGLAAVAAGEAPPRTWVRGTGSAGDRHRSDGDEPSGICRCRQTVPRALPHSFTGDISPPHGHHSGERPRAPLLPPLLGVFGGKGEGR